MITIEDKLILKRKVHLQSGQQAIKTFKLIKCRYRSSSFEIYDIYDNEINQQLTLKMLIKTQQLSKQKSINQIKNQKLFSHLPNFISLIDIYEDSSFIYLIMQKWGVTLGQIVAIKNTLTEYQVQMILSQLLDIIVELRKVNIAHNWITLDTIFIDIKNKHRIKLGQFGRSFNVGKYFQSLAIDDFNRLSSSGLPEHHPRRFSRHNKATIYTQKPIYIQSQLVISPYSSPQQVELMQSKEQIEYADYLSTLYEGDLWAVGVIVYRLLMGRFPFEVVDNNTVHVQQLYENYHHQQQLRPNTYNSISKKDKPFGVRRNYSTDSNDTTALLSSLIKQCCYNFHPNQQQLSRSQLINSLSQPISPHFQQFIKSLLKPINKRATLKILLSHPLKLRHYDNVREVDFGDYSAQLLNQNNVIICETINNLRKQLVEKFQQREKTQQTCQQNKQQLLKYLTPDPNSPTFPLYNSDSFPFSLQSQAQSTKYFTSWQLNFNPSYSQHQDFAQQNPRSSQTVDKFENQSKKNSQQSNVNKHQIYDKTKKKYFNQAYQNQIEQNDHHLSQQQKLSPHRNSSKFLKQNYNSQKYQDLQQQVSSSSIHYSLNENQNLSRTLSTQNFNIRSINPSKKTIEMGQKKQCQQSKKFGMSMTKQSPHSSWHQKSGTYGQYDWSRKQIQKHIELRQSYNQYKSNDQNDNKSIRFYQQYEEQDQIIQNSHRQTQQSAISSNYISSKKKTTIRIRIDNEDMDEQIHQYRDTIVAQELIVKTYLQPIPLLVQQPQFILQYKLDKLTRSLGYVLNNGLGVIYSTGKHIMGHNQTDFALLSKAVSPPIQSNQSSFQYNNQFKTNSQKTLTEEEQQIYNYYIKLFGKRMVVSNFSLSVVKYWQQGRVFIFLINNGSWQVTFEGKKTSKFFIIDQHQLIWTKAKNYQNPELLNVVRKIVEDKKNSIIRQNSYS